MIESGIVPTLLPDRYLFLKGRRELDLLILDEEVSQMSVLVGDAAECAAIANEMRESSKDAVGVAYAVGAAKLRADILPGGKIRSEAQISTEIQLDNDYQKVQQAYSEARLDAGLWGALAESMRTKSYAISVTPELVSQGFITPTSIMEKRRSQTTSGPIMAPRTRLNA